MGTLQGETRDELGPVADVAIHIKGVEVDTLVGANIEGKYELQLKAGEYQLKTSYLGYAGTKTTVVIKPDEVYKHISELEMVDLSMPFRMPGEAIDDLYGCWIAVYIKMDGKTTKQPKQIGNSMICFRQLEKHVSGLGRVSYNDGCNGGGYYWFKHSGSGKIEMESSGSLSQTTRGCDDKYINTALMNGLSKIVGHFEVQFMENNEILIKNDAVEMRLRKQISDLQIGELFGKWRVDYIKYGSKKIEQPTQIGDSGLVFASAGEPNIRSRRATLFYNSGCHISEKSPISIGNGVVNIIAQRHWKQNKHCKDLNAPFVERVRALMGGFAYTLKDENTLIIKTNKRNYWTKKRVKMQLIRVKELEFK